MANNPYVNKVEYAGQTIMDISDTTAESGNVASGAVFYTASGERTVGTMSSPTGGNSRLWYATCDTAAATQQKAVTISGLTELVVGDVFNIVFTYQQNYNGTPTLKINNLTAYPINRLTSVGAIKADWRVGEMITLVWNGTVFIMADGGAASGTYYGFTKLTDSVTTTGSLALSPAGINSYSESTVTGAPVYSASSTYNVGDRVRYDFNTWVCVENISTPEAWNPLHWNALPPIQNQIDGLSVQLGNQISELSTRINTLTSLLGNLKYIEIPIAVNSFVDIRFTQSDPNTDLNSASVWLIVSAYYGAARNFGVWIVNGASNNINILELQSCSGIQVEHTDPEDTSFVTISNVGSSSGKIVSAIRIYGKGSMTVEQPPA